MFLFYNLGQKLLRIKGSLAGDFVSCSSGVGALFSSVDIETLPCWFLLLASRHGDAQAEIRRVNKKDEMCRNRGIYERVYLKNTTYATNEQSFLHTVGLLTCLPNDDSKSSVM